MQQIFYKLPVMKTDEYLHCKCSEQKKTEICSFLLLTIDSFKKITEILQAQINR